MNKKNYTTDCKIEYKINEDMAEFMDMRGLLKEDELHKLKDEITKVKETEESIKVNNTRTRRDGSEVDAEDCCCPPRNVMMPTFITENKFNRTLDRIKKIDNP